MLSPRILLSDDFLVAVDKPSGMVVHRGTGHEGDDLRSWLMARLKSQGHADTEQLSPAHRLDRDTSGVVLFGRGPVANRFLQEALTAGQVKKTYLALVQGVAHRKGRIDTPLAPPDGPGPRGRSAPPQAAETRYRRLIYTRAASLLRVRPTTGRPHQIRRHLTSIGHPVAGDLRFGDVPFNRWIAREHGLDRLFLHAAQLSLTHPFSGLPIEITAPLPEALAAVLASLEFPTSTGEPEGED